MKLKDKAQLEAWLEKNEFDAVVEELKKQLKTSKTGMPLYSDALVLSAQLKKLKSDKIERVLSYEQESLSLNNFRRSLVEFIEMVEKYKGEEADVAPVSATKKVEKSAERKAGFGWLWLLLPLVAFGIWWFFIRTNPSITAAPTANIKICNLSKMSNQGHCCLEDFQRISLYNDGATLYVTAALPGYNNDPAIKGIVTWKSGETFPTGAINLTLDTTIGDLCYSSMIQPLNGIKWVPGNYILQIQVNGKVIAEKEFEIIP
ncbi:MAG: hypothetical protein K9J37_12685 [Saprospiraceae bacterium]|nr:hypothetical protein [Saprospiraceae bacterium]MCF8250766.1 hypothetical protein [Saprospiraceae bacterium]MCF8282178.1 hypothetical protein [Bacteroidales bacterium]MCF8312567.1 hypothetical protein [Saprospiraceae bacterium]MCF8440896.1 hypothetical protein [Saprospiraceae bacterium]